MRAMTLPEKKEVMLQVMDRIHDLCQEHGLKYYLAYGTLLGAVRHHGFIPWDDDMDIVMFREEFDKFCQLFPQDDPQFQLLHIHNSADYYSNIPKVIDKRTLVRENIANPVDVGVWVDVFIIDYLGDSKLKAMAKVRQVSLLNELLKITYAVDKPKRSWLTRKKLKLKQLIQNKVDRRSILEKVDKASINTTPGKYCGCVDQRAVRFKEILPSDIYAERVLLDFEGRQYYAPAKYQEFLTHLYGDYMTPPPPAAREPQHDCLSYWRD